MTRALSVSQVRQIQEQARHRHSTDDMAYCQSLLWPKTPCSCGADDANAAVDALAEALLGAIGDK